ncbi:MAG TPA: acyl-CoA dehydrogenase family protein, partial [Acetobacteraceae bacterium]|nr:acyl-CoA dehydrogenase family protein [Acetobacteraceae bacterium]
MAFRLTPAPEALASVARRFATEQLPDLARCRESDGVAVPRDCVRPYAELGFLGVNVATDYGGLGLGNREALPDA